MTNVMTRRSLAIVDDDTDFALSLAEVLREEGYLCQTAHSGHDARALFGSEEDPGVMLVDVRLGEESGIALIQQLQETRPETRFIVLTAYADMELVMSAFQHEVSGFLRKPLVLPELFALLERCFESRRLRTERDQARRSLDERNRTLQATVDRLERSEGLLQRVLDSAGEAVVSLDLRRRVVVFNRQAEAMFGYSSAEALGMPVETLLPERHRSAHPDKVSAFVNDSENALVRSDRRAEVCGLRRCGEEFPVAISISKAGSGDGTVLTAIVCDLSEQRRTEAALSASQAQLFQSQKLEALGHFACGVAHDFNNLLTVINGYAGLLLRQAEDGSPLAADLGQIMTAAESAGALTTQLLAFGRRVPLSQEVFDVNQVIRKTARLLARALGDDVTLNLSLADVGALRTDPHRFQQMLINMALNGRQAMPTGGTLTLATQTIEVGEEFPHESEPLEPGSYVLITVEDTGCGMDEATRSQIFLPFYTTKPQGQGSGLGLSTAHGFVAQAGGAIRVSSQRGQGTRFEVYLPRERAPEPTQPTADSILLVDDNDQVRALCKRVLESAGYRTVEASSGAQALEQLADAPALLITDVLMPGLSGPELVARVRERHPAVPVLLTSGHVGGGLNMEGTLEDGMPLLPKPFTPTRLLEEVARLLSRVSEGSP